MSTGETVDDLYKLMNRDLSFDEKAQQALEIGERHLNVDNGHLTKIHPESEYWKAIASTDPQGGEFPPGLVLDLSTSYCRRVVSGEQSVALHDAPAQGWEDDPAFQEHGLHCYHGSPLQIDDETYGTVCFVSHTPRPEPFSDEETMFAELVARLLEYELKRQRDKAKIDRLEDFASVLSHDIRNPLTVATGRVRYVQDQYESEHLDVAENALERIDKIISEVLEMAHQGQNITETEELQLREFASHCWETVASEDASLYIDDDLCFRAAQDRLQHVFENLFRNAIEHGGESVDIRVGALAGDGFYIEDDGPGIPEEERTAALDAEYTTGDGNLGLGLAIAENVAMAHDWELKITESSNQGARFEFRGVIIAESTAE